MDFQYPRRGVFMGVITTSFQYSTATGDIYAYEFQHFPDGPAHNIMLYTRHSIIQEKYSNQIFEFGKSPLEPHNVKVTIASDGLAFEVFEIEILDP